MRAAIRGRPWRQWRSRGGPCLRRGRATPPLDARRCDLEDGRLPRQGPRRRGSGGCSGTLGALTNHL